MSSHRARAELAVFALEPTVLVGVVAKERFHPAHAVNDGRGVKGGV